MVLAVGIGFALRAALDLPQAPLFTLVLGIVLAPMVPSKSSCGLPARDRQDAGKGTDAGSGTGDHAQP